MIQTMILSSYTQFVSLDSTPLTLHRSRKFHIFKHVNIIKTLLMIVSWYPSATVQEYATLFVVHVVKPKSFMQRNAINEI
jgi:hypothetical protein